VRGDDKLKSGHKTGWRKDAAKIIVVFGDRMSWQTSVNEKELKELARATGAKIIFIDTYEMNNSTGRRSVYDSHSGSQMQDAAVEIADASDGVYIKLDDLSKMKEAIVDSVFDALADNSWRGGMLARVGASSDQQWRMRTHSSVTATSADEGRTLNVELRTPNQPTSKFTVDTTAATRVNNTGYYQGNIDDAKDIFGKDMTGNMSDGRSKSICHTNKDNSFMRFILRDGASGVVESYYGQRLTDASQLPASDIKTISSYDMRHRVIDPSGGLSSAAGALKLFVNWRDEDVYGIETNAQLAGGTGTAIFVGKVDRDRKELTGSYLYKTRETGGKSLVIRDAARDTTTLQMCVAGLGGTFGAVFDRSGYGSGSLSAMTMSGFRKQAEVANTDARVRNDIWKGYAAGWVRNGGSVQSAHSINPNEVQISLNPGENSVTANVNMRIGGTGASVGFANAGSEVDGENLYITKDAFVAVKDIHGTPSYVAAAGDDGLDYMTWGVWSVEAAHSGMANATVLDGSHWIAGRMTPDVDMPTTGTATYNGSVHGTAYESGALHALTGTSRLEANFGTGNIGGALNINYVNGGAYATSNLSSVSIRNGNQFGGSLGGADNGGSIQGAFYGPGKSAPGGFPLEVGGNWNINKNNGASHATGVFTGKKK